MERCCICPRTIAGKGILLFVGIDGGHRFVCSACDDAIFVARHAKNRKERSYAISYLLRYADDTPDEEARIYLRYHVFRPCKIRGEWKLPWPPEMPGNVLKL